MTAQPARMRDQDRVDLEDHGRNLDTIAADVGALQMDVHDLKETVARVEKVQGEHGAMLRAIVNALNID